MGDSATCVWSNSFSGQIQPKTYPILPLTYSGPCDLFLQLSFVAESNTCMEATNTSLKNKQQFNSCILLGEGSLPVYCMQLLQEQGCVIKAIVSTEKQVLQAAAQYQIPSFPAPGLVPDLEVEFIFSINNPYILKPEFIQRATRMAINYHDSPLPKYAGLYATNQAILHGEIAHGISWHELTTTIDGGAILASKTVEIGPNDTAYALNIKCYEAAMEAFREALPGWLSNTFEKLPQADHGGTYYGQADRPFHLGMINWAESPTTAQQLIHACAMESHLENPFLMASFIKDKQVYFIKEAYTAPATSGTMPGLVRQMGNYTTVDLDGGFLVIEKIIAADGHEPSVQEVLKRGEQLVLPATAWFEAANGIFQKTAKYENFWKNELENAELAEWTNHQLGANLSDYAGLIQGSAELLPLIVTFLQRITGKLKTTFAYVPAGIPTDQHLFSKWVPLTTELEANDSIENALGGIAQKIKRVQNAITYRSDLMLRYPTLTILRGKQPQIYIVEVGTDVSFLPDPALVVQLTPTGVSVTGLSAEAFHALEYFIQSATKNKGEIWTKLPLMSAESEQAWLEVLNQPTHSLPQTSLDPLFRIFEVAKMYPQHTAIVDQGQKISYQQLSRDVKTTAAWLNANGIGEGHVLMVEVARTYDYFKTFLAGLFVGATVVPLDFKLPEERIKLICSRAKPNAVVLITKRDFPFEDLKVLRTQNAKLVEETPALKPYPDAGAYILFTSGSSGLPKGVGINRKSLTTFVDAALGLYNMSAQDKVIQFAHLAFDTSIEETFMALCSGATLYLREESWLLPDQLAKIIVEEGITVLDLPTAYWRQWLMSDAYPLANASQSLRLTIIGGEAMYKEDWTTWNQSNPQHRLINSYGPTECTVIALAEEIKASKKPADRIAIGKPLPGYSIRIVDQWGSTLPQGLAGILHIMGDAVSFGYVGADPTDKAHASFMNHFDHQGRTIRSHSTGDTVVAATDGTVYYLGRFDRQVKIRGFRIGLDEISSQIKCIEGVSDAVVQVVHASNRTPSLAAFVLVEDAECNSTTIREKLSTQVPDYMVPETILMIAEIPLTSNGKVDARKLESLLAQTRTNRVEVLQLPEGPVESYLHELWCKLFKRDNISVEDDFFELGGHSLLAVQLVANLKKEFNIEFPLASLITYPTIRKLAELVNSRTVEHLWNVMVPIRTKGSLAPIFLIHGAGLNVLMFQSLARYLNPDRPIYALQARKIDPGQSQQCTIPSIAADYLQEIKKIQPNGPYHLLGYSIGGFIVFEMTKQLEANQEKVAFAGLVDSAAAFAQASKGWSQRMVEAVLTPIAKLTFAVHAFLKEERRERQRFLMQKKNNLLVSLYSTLSKFKLVKLPSEEAPSNQERGSYTVSASTIALTRALAQYKLEPIATRIDLFKAEKASFYIRDRKHYGWDPYLQNGINAHVVPGNHNHIFVAPNDQVFAEVLEARLNEIVCTALQASKHGKHHTPVEIIDYCRNNTLQPAFADLWPPLHNAN